MAKLLLSLILTVCFVLRVTNGQVITAQVTRSSSGPLTAGQTGFSLSCDVTGTENLNTPTFTYLWRRNGGVISGQQGSTLSLSPIAASNAGEYNCSVTVSSTSLSSTVTVNSVNTQTVSIQLPAPTSVTVTNGSVNAGSTVTLTCTVELSPAVDVPVTVNTVWTGPDGFMTTNTAQRMGSTTTYTSTAMVSSFGRDQSGNYTCTATVSSTSSFLTNSMGSSSTRVTVGVYLSHNGVIIESNRIILITDIGTSSPQHLVCTTDRSDCCQGSRFDAVVNWLFPDGGEVPHTSSAQTFGRDRNNNGETNLYRANNDVMSPAGRFCCRALDAIGTVHTPCVVIISVTIATIGSPTAGISYTLKCSVSGTSDPASYQWFGPPNGQSITNSSSRMVFSNFSLTLLEFSPLQASHAGLYSCRATVNGVVAENSASVTAINPNVAATIRDMGALPMLGQHYFLNCNVTVVDSLLNPTMTYQWTKNNGTQTQVGTNSNTLLFTSLKLSDAGRYKCEVTIASVSLDGNINVAAFKNVIIQISAPTTVIVTPPVGTIIAGSSPNLTCTVELSPSVDVPVTVETVWSGPASTTVTTTNLMMESLTRYIILGMVDEARNDNYICQATVSSSSAFTTSGGMTSGSTTITVGPLPPPTDLLVSRPSLATSISLSWEQPLGAGAIQSYQINYSYTINECSRDSVGRIMQGSVNVGNVRTYNLSNSSQTPVEEDSVYSITVTAVNNVGNSIPSATRMTTTAPAAPSGAPQNLQALVVNATSITLQWDEVACQLRNGMIDGYQISYSGVNVTVSNGNTYTANRLLPQKSYTFSVNAFSSSLGPGPQVRVTNETPALLLVTIDFKLTSSQDSTVVTFSLTCNSTGGLVSSVIWTRDGLLLDNTGPLVLTDVSTASYTNVLQVNSRTPGIYTCQIRGAHNQILSSVDFNVHAAPPPLNVQATQSSASAPVEVSWSPPSSGATNITGYRIFYGNGKNVSMPAEVTGIVLALNKDSVGETVSVRSEADQLASQLITVTVTTNTEAATKSSHSSALDVGVTFGVMLLLLCVVSVVFTLVLIFIWRKRRVGEYDSTNMPTQLYEDPDKLTSRSQGNYDLTHCPAYESTTTKPEPPPRTQAEVDQSSHYEL